MFVTVTRKSLPLPMRLYEGAGVSMAVTEGARLLQGHGTALVTGVTGVFAAVSREAVAGQTMRPGGIMPETGQGTRKIRSDEMGPCHGYCDSISCMTIVRRSRVILVLYYSRAGVGRRQEDMDPGVCERPRAHGCTGT